MDAKGSLGSWQGDAMTFCQGCRQERHIQAGGHDVAGWGSSPIWDRVAVPWESPSVGDLLNFAWVLSPTTRVPSLIKSLLLSITGLCLVLVIGAHGLQDA